MTGEQQSCALCVCFNQDSTSLAVGTRKGYRLYSITNGDEVQLIHEAGK
jgi:hypothetical protein